MTEISQETINRALLGEQPSIQTCTRVGYVLPCPVCDNAVITLKPIGASLFYRCDDCGRLKFGLAKWNDRPVREANNV